MTIGNQTSAFRSCTYELDTHTEYLTCQWTVIACLSSAMLLHHDYKGH